MRQMIAMGAQVLLLASPALAQDEDLEHQRSNVERLIQRHDHFPRLGLEAHWQDPNFAWLVQVPGTAGPEFVPAVLEQQSARSRAFLASFEEKLARPLELERRAGLARWVTVVLAGTGDFAEYYQASYGAASGLRHAYYDLPHRWLVLSNPPADEHPEALWMEEQERALQILHGYSSSAVYQPRPYALAQGVAAWVARGLGPSRHEVCEWLVDPAGVAVLFDPKELGNLPRYQDVVAAVQSRASRQGLGPVYGWRAHRAFVATSALLWPFLLHEESPELARGTRQALAAAFQGQAAPAEWWASLADPELAVRFWTWVVRSHEADCRDCPEDLRAGLGRFLDQRFPDLHWGSVVPVASVFEVSDLMAAVQGQEGLLAVALARLERGDGDTALADLLSVVDGEELGDEERRVLREVARLEAWLSQRDAFLRHVIVSGETLILKEPKVRAKVVRLEDGWIHFEANEPAPLELRRLPSAQLSAAMIAKRTQFRADWGAAYPLAVMGDERALTWLEAGELQAKRLASDARRDYPDREAARQAVGQLLDWTASIDVQDTEAVLTGIQQLVAQRDQVSFLSDMLPGLRALALRCLADRGTVEEQLSRLSEIGFPP